MNAKKSVNRSKYWKGALQFAKRNTDDIEVVSPYNPLLEQYFDNQMDMVSIKNIARNAVTENQIVNENNVELKMETSNNKTSVKELTEEECTEVEKHIKEIFQDLVTNKHIENYEENKKMIKMKNEVRKEKQTEHKDTKLHNPLMNSSVQERGNYCNLSLSYQHNSMPFSSNRSRSLFEQSSMDFQRSSYHPLSINIQRNSPLFINDQTNTYNPFSIDNYRKTNNSFSLNDPLFRDRMNFNNSDFGNHSLYNQRESYNMSSINSIQFSRENLYYTQRDIIHLNTIGCQRNSSNNQFFEDINIFNDDQSKVVLATNIYR